MNMHGALASGFTAMFAAPDLRQQSSMHIAHPANSAKTKHSDIVPDPSHCPSHLLRKSCDPSLDSGDR